MTTMIVTTRITHKYLMGKSKWDLCQMIMMLPDDQDRLTAENVNLRESAEILKRLEGEARAEVTRLTAELASMRERERWIPCAERMPKFRDRVQVYMQNDYEIIATFYLDHWTHDGGMRVENKNVTHWRPLPAPPEVDNA